MGTCSHTSNTFRHTISPPSKLKLNLQCESVSPSTLARPVSKSVTHAGSCTASSTASSQMVKCQATRPSVAVTTVLTLFSAKPAPASTYHVQYSSISSRPLLTRSELELTANCSTLSS